MPSTYFMSGVRPIEIIMHFALCEQAPTDNMHNYFCMAELLQKFCRKCKKYLHSIRKYNKISKCQTDGSLVKRLRRRPLTAETGVRFPYELLIKPWKSFYLCGFHRFYFFTKIKSNQKSNQTYVRLNYWKEDVLGYRTIF